MNYQTRPQRIKHWIVEDLETDETMQIPRWVIQAIADNKIRQDTFDHVNRSVSVFTGPLEVHASAAFGSVVVQYEDGTLDVFEKAELETTFDVVPMKEPKVGCERDDGLLNVHPESTTCEVCVTGATP